MNELGDLNNDTFSAGSVNTAPENVKPSVPAAVVTASSVTVVSTKLVT